ncbi:MAG: transcription factor S [Thermoplasmata archaeon]
MSLFCPECQSLMYPKEGELVCSNSKCGYSRKIGEEDDRQVVRTKRKEKMETLVLDEIIATLPKTRIECPECGNNEAFWKLRQTRAADEPETRIYRCTKCGHTWREY